MKMFKMSNFTLFHNILYANCFLKSFNSQISVVVCSFFEFRTVSKWYIREWVSSLSHNKLLDLSKNESNCKHKQNVNKHGIFLLYGRKYCGKRNVGYQQSFIFFHNVFKNLLPSFGF